MFLLARHIAPVLEVLVAVILLDDQFGCITLRAVLNELCYFALSVPSIPAGILFQDKGKGGVPTRCFLPPLIPRNGYHQATSLFHIMMMG